MKQEQQDRISREIKGLFRTLGRDITPDPVAERLVREHKNRRSELSMSTKSDTQYMRT